MNKIIYCNINWQLLLADLKNDSFVLMSMSFYTIRDRFIKEQVIKE